jgi:general secretion pathway protein A
MFEAHFGLRETPFSTSHDPRFLYPSTEHLEAVSHFRFGVQNRESFVLVTGEVGTGKTTAVRDLVGRLPQHAHVALLQNTALSRQELLEEVCRRFSVHWEEGLSKPAILGRLERSLGERIERGEVCLLVIDEAQNLTADLLEEIRLLSNLEWNERHLLHICLAGQPELEERLIAPELRPLRQRISVKYRLKPLDAAETARYIEHRIRVAGGDGARIFPADACAVVHALTHGIPREINVVAAQAMVNAFVEGSASVRPEHVRLVVQEFGFQSVLSRERQAAARVAEAHRATSPSAASPLGPQSVRPLGVEPISPPAEERATPAVAPRPAVLSRANVAPVLVTPAMPPRPPPLGERAAVSPVPAAIVSPVTRPTSIVGPALAASISPAPVSPSTIPVAPPSSVAATSVPASGYVPAPSPYAVPSAPRERAPVPLPVAAPTAVAVAEREDVRKWWEKIPLSLVVMLLIGIAAGSFLASGLGAALWRTVSTGTFEELVADQDGAGSDTVHQEPPAPARPSAPRTRTNPPPVTAASPATGGYAIQVASYRSERVARSALESLQRSTGLQGRVDTSPDGEWTRVILGRYDTAAEAAQAGDELAGRGAVPTDRIVVRNRG